MNLDKENPMTEDAFRQTALSLLQVSYFIKNWALFSIGFTKKANADNNGS